MVVDGTRFTAGVVVFGSSRHILEVRIKAGPRISFENERVLVFSVLKKKKTTCVKRKAHARWVHSVCHSVTVCVTVLYDPVVSFVFCTCRTSRRKDTLVEG